MKKHTRLKILIPLPKGSKLSGKVGDSTLGYTLYEIEKAEILEEIEYDSLRDLQFLVKDGQYVNRGDIIFTMGFLGHKAMIADFSGIVDLGDWKCRILGHKVAVRRKINLRGRVARYIPGSSVVIDSRVTSVVPAFYLNSKNLLSEKVYLGSRHEILQENFRFPDLGYTYFVNDNIYVDDLAKMVAFGARRVVVNGIFIDNLEAFNGELKKLDAFAVLSGFGEMVSVKFRFVDKPQYDVFWGKRKLYIGDDLELPTVITFEHPFWGMSGSFYEKDHVMGMLDVNGEKITIYKKNIHKFV